MVAVGGGGGSGNDSVGVRSGNRRCMAKSCLTHRFRAGLPKQPLRAGMCRLTKNKAMHPGLGSADMGRHLPVLRYLMA